MSDRQSGGSTLAEKSTAVGGGVVAGVLLWAGRYLPGTLLLLVIGLAGKWAASLAPHINYALSTIIIGMVISNTVELPEVFARGVAAYGLWLKTGIVLMGARLALGDVLAIGQTGLMLVLIEIGIALFTASLLARCFGLSEKLGSLIGVGVGICGVSAVAASTGAIDAEEEDATYAIATILMFGAVMVVLFPLLGSWLQLGDQFFGFWSGLAIDNTATAVGAGFAYSETAGEIATVIKMTRNALMGVVILGMALAYARRGLTSSVQNRAAFVWERFPRFLLGFAMLSGWVSLGALTGAQVESITSLSRWFCLLAFAGVGLRSQLSRMKAGYRPFLVGLGVETAVAAATFVMLLVIL